MKKTLAALFACAALGMSLSAFAQAYPTKPIRLVVPFPPGGAVDLTGRLLQQRLSATLGQPVVVENRAGNGGMMGAQEVSRAPADGYSVVYTVGSDLAMRPYLSKTPTVDPLKELTPIGSFVESVGCIAVASSLGISSMAELVDYAKKNPGKLNYSTPGVNSAPHLSGELLKLHGMDMVHVPFNGTAPGALALLQGQVQVAITNVASVQQYLRDGKVKVLAMTRAKRFEDMPDVPAISEVLPGYDMPVAFYGVFGPAGLPQPVVVRVNQELSRALEAPEIRAKVKELSMSALYTTPEQFTAMMRSASETYAKIVKTAGLKPE